MMTEIRCTRCEREEDFQRYLGGGMSDAEQDAFEQHYFECGECFEALEIHRAIRVAVVNDRMPPATRFVPLAFPRILWAGFAVAAVLVIGVSIMPRVAPEAIPPSATPVVPSAENRTSPAPRLTALNELARFDAPPYHAATSRAAETAEASAFRVAMTAYQAGAFANAARQLRTVGRGASPEETRFFLGISELESGEADAGVADLRAVVAMGDTAYFEEAAYFLAKALLGRQDVDGARELLQRLVDTRGDRAADAARLLQRIRELPPQ